MTYLKPVNHTGDATLLRKVNESAILELIREKGPIARSEIARRLDLSPPTITRIVNVLIKEDIVLKVGPGNSRGGRRPMLLEFNDRASLIIGVYVGQNMVGALADLNGEILERRSVPSLPGERGIQQLAALIEGLHQASRRFGPSVRGVGIGAPSITLFREGIVTWAPSLEWRNLPLKRRLEEKLGLSVFVENEVNLIALGESWRGAGRGFRNIVCISLGAGIGAGLILNGQLYRGSHDAAGEVGYVIPNERYLGHTYDDAYGCLESLAGSTGILKRTRQRLKDGQSSVLAEPWNEEPSALTVQMVLEAAREGDPVGEVVVQETVDYLSIAVANLACILDPERIIISGDLAEFGDLFLDLIRSRLKGLVPTAPDIVLSDLGMDAAMLGAVAIALRQTSDQVFVHRQM
ncbi:MAG: N-acetylglucosamine repressor [Anaerolineales bacterium]|nr:N-acetylglucosamine repressor [Anaerolineales bacterium]